MSRVNTLKSRQTKSQTCYRERCWWYGMDSVKKFERAKKHAHPSFASKKHVHATFHLQKIQRSVCSKKKTSLGLSAKIHPGEWYLVKTPSHMYFARKTLQAIIRKKLYMPQCKLLTSINVNRIPHETTTYGMQSDFINTHSVVSQLHLWYSEWPW